MVQDKLKEIEKRLKKIEKKVRENIPLTKDLQVPLKEGTDKILNLLNRTIEENILGQKKKKTPQYSAIKKSLEKNHLLEKTKKKTKHGQR